MDNKLIQLMEKCKCGIHIGINVHRDFYQTARESLKEKECYECPPEIADDVRQKMIDTDTIIELQFYPDTPIGSYCVYHYDLDAALTEALGCLP